MVMASCSNDETLVGNTPAGALDHDVAIGFERSAQNMSRTTNLEEEYLQFGVYAIKAADQGTILYNKAAEGSSVVMDNYMVGYWGGEGSFGYMPKNGQNLYNATWYYEGLGNGQTGNYEFQAGTSGKTAETSLVNEQYLKYWDLSRPYTYFYAYEPYGKATLEMVDLDENNKNLTKLAYTEAVSGANMDNVMFAVEKCANETYAVDGSKVQLKFQRLTGGIRMAFYSAIPGWDVYLTDYSTSQEGIVVVPAEKKNDGSYDLGSIIGAGKPAIYFNETDVVKIEYLDPVADSRNIECPLLNNWPANTGAKVKELKIGNSYGSKTVGPTYNVMPSQVNTGMTLNVSFKLVAKDTQEVIYVKGARVYVDAANTQWKPNTLYTYVFRITNLVPGSTKPEPEPEVKPEPNPNQALFPIVFDQVTITDMNVDQNENEWDINPGEGEATGPHSYKDHEKTTN